MTDKQGISPSLFYMWRCIIAIAHADSVFQESERAYLEKIISNIDRVHGLTTEQKSIFAEDFKTPQQLADLLPHINDQAVRGQLVYFGGLLARADGEMHPSEDSILKKLHADQMSSVDMKALRAAVQEKIAQEVFRYDLENGQLHPKGGFTAILDALLLKLGIDILD